MFILVDRITARNRKIILPTSMNKSVRVRPRPRNREDEVTRGKMVKHGETEM